MSPRSNRRELQGSTGANGLRSRARQMLALLAFSVAVLPLTACGNFFVNASATGTTPTTPTSTSTSGDFVYVANSAAGTTYLSEYSIASNALNSLGSLPLGYIPVALAVAPGDNFLYVASVPGAATPGVYLYSIGTTGELSAANGGQALVTDTVAAMAISPDGKWLYTVNVDGITMAQYQINTSTGLLTSAGATTLPGAGCDLTAATPVTQSCSVAVSPSGEYVIASLGASGDIVYPYSSASGISGSTAEEISSGYSVANPTGDYSVAMDADNYAYIARTNSLGVYQITSSSVPEEGTLPFAAGTVPRSVTLSKTYDFLYVAGEGSGTISGFGIGTNGALTAISGSPFAAPASVAALAVDNTGGYLVAVGYSATAGVQLYSISLTGALSPVAEAGSGTDAAYPALVAVTH